MQAILEHPAAPSFTETRTAPVSDDIADLVALERKLEEVLSSGTFIAPPGILSFFGFGSMQPRVRELTARDRARFDGMLNEVRAELEKYRA